MDPEYNIDKMLSLNEYTTSTRSEQEIKEHEIPDDLDEIERSKILLEKTNKVQRISVLINLPNIIRDFPEAEEVLLPSIFENVLGWDEELQVE